MELTVNTSSFTFANCSHLNDKLNKNSDLTFKRLHTKHKNKLLKFKNWFSKEHDYCIPIKKKSKFVQSDNDIEEDNKYSDETIKFESDSLPPNSFKMAANPEEINVNYECNSNAYAVDVTTELLKDALLENQSKYKQSSDLSKNCISPLRSCPLSEHVVQPSENKKSCVPKESTPPKLFSSMDIDNDMIKLFPNLDFSTEHLSDEKMYSTENRETNTDSIILYKNKSDDKTLSKNLLSSSLSSSTNKTNSQFETDQYLSILNRYQIKSNTKFIEQTEDSEPILLKNLLLGSKPKTIISPYTQRHLKPYILRDPVMKPLWLQMLNELKEHYRRKKGRSLLHIEVETIDFSYIRVKHIGPVNALARQFFWPGIDFSESLMYPDFSVVALYKNLIVGFGFMVPDIKTNENYITFLFTRPYWTNCGIAKFMIYHLIQTCVTRDITLHVSSNSPAVILYQKFGFKIEEFVQNFYENYISLDSGMSRNALFLRLRSTLHRK